MPEPDRGGRAADEEPVPGEPLRGELQEAEDPFAVEYGELGHGCYYGSVQDPWPLLERGGVPIGAPRRRSGAAPTPAALVQALRAVVASPDELTGRQRDALAAWLCAWASHWPRSYRQAFGEGAEDLRARFEQTATDRGRHVKLRRIALSHLAGIL